MSELLEIRVIGASEAAVQAVVRLGALFTLDRLNGPHPGRLAAA